MHQPATASPRKQLLTSPSRGTCTEFHTRTLSPGRIYSFPKKNAKTPGQIYHLKSPKSGFDEELEKLFEKELGNAFTEEKGLRDEFRELIEKHSMLEYDITTLFAHEQIALSNGKKEEEIWKERPKKTRTVNLNDEFERKWEKITEHSPPNPKRKQQKPEVFQYNDGEMLRKLIHAKSKCSINKSKGIRSIVLQGLLDKVERFQKYRKRIPSPHSYKLV